MVLDNKKGQEGVTLTTILLMVVGVVVVVLIILFATGFFDKLNAGVDSTGSKTDIAAKACEVAGSNDLKSDYCLKFREIEVDSKSVYATCKYSAINDLMDQTVVSSFGDICSEIDAPNATAFCINEKLSGKQVIVVDDVVTTCEALVENK